MGTTLNQFTYNSNNTVHSQFLWTSDILGMSTSICHMNNIEIVLKIHTNIQVLAKLLGIKTALINVKVLYIKLTCTENHYF